MDKLKNLSQPLKSALQLAIIGLCALPLLYYKLAGNPTHRGFFCKDQSLSYPYHSSTVPSWSLYVFGIFIPILIFVISEYICNKKSFKIRCFQLLNIYMIGAVGSHLIVDVGKYTVGRLRPHFFDLCQPQVNGEPVNDTNACNENNGYVLDYTCNPNMKYFEGDVEEAKSRANKEVHLSFPSGHASFSAQAATFVVLYLQTRFINKTNSGADSSHTSYFIATLISLLAILAAGFVSVSRIMDYKHHPTDALVGSLIGILTQVCLNLRFLIFFNQEPKLQNRSPESIALNKTYGSQHQDAINNDDEVNTN